MLAELCAAQSWSSASTAYAVLGGADFGAGFWDLTAGGAERGARVRGMVKRSMGPVWEANHVWLIVVLVVMWTCFPPAFGPLMETLYVPIFLAGGRDHLARRSLRACAARRRRSPRRAWLGATFALSSVLTPFFLGLPRSARSRPGRCRPDGEPGDAMRELDRAPCRSSPASLAVASGAFIAAVFLAADSVRAGLPDLVAAFRARALGAGIVAGGARDRWASLVVNADAPRPLRRAHPRRRASRRSSPRRSRASTTLSLVWTSALRRRQAQRLGRRRRDHGRPRPCPAALTSCRASSPSTRRPRAIPTLIATLDRASRSALAVIVPSLAYLFRLTLAGRLDPEFHPIGSSEENG